MKDHLLSFCFHFLFLLSLRFESYFLFSSDLLFVFQTLMNATHHELCFYLFHFTFGTFL